MARTAARIGYGAQFAIHDGGSPGTYVKAAEVTSIKPPGYTRATVDATHLESDGGFMEYIAGLKDTSEASFGLNWLPDEDDVMVALFEAGDGLFQITAPLPDRVRMQFAGIVTAYEPGDVTPDGKLTASVTIKPTGEITLLAPV